MRTDQNLDHVIGLAQAANRAGKDVDLFFTGEGVLLTQEGASPSSWSSAE